MEIVNQVLDELFEGIEEKDHDDKAKISKVVRQKARISCRDLGAVLGLSVGQISDIEQGRLDVSEGVVMAWIMVCLSKLIVKKEMSK